jgi:hypothetical protein
MHINKQEARKEIPAFDKYNFYKQTLAVNIKNVLFDHDG